MGKKFDICIQNPPYDNGLHEKFLLKMLQISDKVISVQPLSWLLGKRQNKKITSIIDKSTAEIEQINGNTYFDAAIGGTMGIISVDLTSVPSDIVFDGKAYSKCEEITTYSNDELLVEFKNIVEPLAKKDNLMNHLCDCSGDKHFSKFYKSTENDNVYCLRFVPFAGTGSKGNTTLNFYKLINRKTVIEGLYKDLVNNDKFKMYIVFDNHNAVQNFINFTETIFCIGCLYLKKHTLNLYADETSLIPWFDFSEAVFSKSPSEIDDYLFKKYNINDKIRKHIEEILPDYYGIRKG